jgi:uncharacterized surface protein with fasciclin (FAS1) repeats
VGPDPIELTTVGQLDACCGLNRVQSRARCDGPIGGWAAVTDRISRALRSHAMPNIVQTAVAAGNFKTLAAALTAANLIEPLSGPGPFTVFAPTDAAFAKIPKADLDALLANKDKLVKVLKFHVLTSKVMASDVAKLKEGAKVKTFEGHDLTLTHTGGATKFNDSTITNTDINASNGVIHAIDTVMMPS